MLAAINVNTCFYDDFRYHIGYRAARHWPMWAGVRKEDVLMLTLGPSVFYIINNSIPHIRQKRQLNYFTRFLLLQSDGIILPNHIGELKTGYIWCPKAQSGRKFYNGIGPFPFGTCPLYTLLYHEYLILAIEWGYFLTTPWLDIGYFKRIVLLQDLAIIKISEKDSKHRGSFAVRILHRGHITDNAAIINILECQPLHFAIYGEWA